MLRPLWPGVVAGVVFALIHAALQWLRGGPVDPALAVLSGLVVTLAWIGPSLWVLYRANQLGGVRIGRQARGGVHGPVVIDHVDRFTERAQRVLQYAQEEASRFGHNYIGTEHLLLGLLGEGQGVAARVLNGLGIDLNAARNSVDFIISRGPGVVGDIGLTPRARKVLELAVDEARRLGHHFVGTEHILLGLVREGEGIALAILESRGLNLGQVREQVLSVLNQPTAATADPQAGAAVPPDATAGGVEAQPRDVIRFNKLSPGARSVLQFANEEAQRLRHTYVGTEHVLLGLLVEHEGPAAKALGDVGVTLERAREEVARLTGQGEPLQRHRDVGLTPRAKRLIERAVREARERRSHEVGTEHLMLGLLALQESTGVRTLDGLGVSSAMVRAALERRLGSTE